MLCICNFALLGETFRQYISMGGESTQILHLGKFIKAGILNSKIVKVY